MGLNHLEIHYSEEAAPYVAEAGGKIGGLNYLRATVPELNDAILPVQVIKPGERLSRIEVPSGEDGRYIVRGSHPMDFQGLVDILMTEVSDAKEVSESVDTIQRQAHSPAILSYGRYENPDFDGRVHVGIQPYMKVQKGSIVEHPNVPNNYVVSFVNFDYEPVSGDMITGVYDSDNDQLETINGFFGRVNGDEARVRQIVDLYRLVDSANLVRPGFSFQMEFLNAESDVFIAQVRAFKKKEQADFELNARKRLVFGITPEEGVVLPVFLSPNNFEYGDKADDSSPWAYLRPCQPFPGLSLRDIMVFESETTKAARRLSFRPQNLAAYLIGQSFSSQINNGLEHHHFRWVQKADLTIFEGGNLGFRGDFTRLFHTMPHEKLRDLMSTMGKTTSEMMEDLFAGKTIFNAKIVSDGRTATVEPVSTKRRRKKKS
jgi:hypothetical protein